MAGLIQQGMQPQQGQPPQGRPPQQGQPPQRPQQPPQGQQGQEPSPEQESEANRAQFKPLMETMLGYLYGEGLERMERVLQGADPLASTGRAIGMVMSTIYNKLSEEGKAISPSVMVRAGIELSKAVGEMAIEMGVIQEGEDEVIEEAFMIGLGHFGKTANDMPREEKQRYAQIVQGLNEGKKASQQGGQQQGMQQGQRPPQQPQQRGGM